MERDVVCGMQVEPAKAAGTSEHQGTTYYFCSKNCKDQVRRQPQPVREVTESPGRQRCRLDTDPYEHIHSCFSKPSR